MSSEKKYVQPKMVNWYDPRQLSATALKTIVSGTFASYADKRELQAALDLEKKPIDCSIDEKEKHVEEIWIDFVSDTGDGFDSTYTVADLVAQPLKINLNPDYSGDRKSEITSWDLPSGDLLLLGGDQVYPTPNMDEYSTRFKIPFKAASQKYHKDSKTRKMFAIPGNHDWYDGLGNFIKLFCQKRTIGKWKTLQRRSYFVIKLPHNYWLWATDVQLNSDIDQPQKDYFEEIASKYMQHGDKVILCTAEPAWVFKVIHRKDSTYKRLKFFEQVFITDNMDYKCTAGKKFKLVATLTGDLHHYSRYEENKKTSDGIEYINHLITAGGGGAFLHPTHNLPEILIGLNDKDDEILANTQFKDPELKSCFPSKKSSRSLANKVLGFPFNNIAFWITMTVVQLLLGWMLQSTTQNSTLPFMEELAYAYNFKEFLMVVSSHLFLNPPVLIICLVVILGMTFFTDANSGKKNYRWLGFLHGLLQLFSMFLFTWLFSWLNIIKLGITNDIVYSVLYIAETFALGGLTGSFIMGVYLWFCNCFLDIHVNESFSSLAHPHFKNFLRMHITPVGTVAIYPIGVEEVVTDWEEKKEGEDITFKSNNSAKYYLIEPPIIIKSI